MRAQTLPLLAAVAMLLFHSPVIAETVCDKVARAIETASKLRELKVLKPVPCLALSRKDFAKLIADELARDNPPERVRSEGLAGKMLGFIPQKYDYERCIASDYGADVLAFYHPDRRAIVFPDWEETPADVLVHEAVHALQDQHFGLAGLRDVANATGDRALALSALAEGDAMEIQNEYNRGVHSQGLAAASAEAPAAIESGCGLPELVRKMFEFPYDYGPFFISHLKSQGGMKSVDAAFRRAPCSTRQILYPREYLARKAVCTAPQANRPPAFLRQLNAKEIYEEVMGEYSVRAYLRAFVSPEDGIRAAKGLRSDTLSLFETQPQKEYILWWSTLWDNSKEAEQFRVVFTKALQRLFGVRLDTTAKQVTFSTVLYPTVSLRQTGNRVELAISERRFDSIFG